MPFLLAILLALASCSVRAPEELAARPATPQASDFLAVALAECRAGCAPRDARWAASEIAGALHVRCECVPLPSLGIEPKPHRNRAARAQKAARLETVAGPSGPEHGGTVE